MSGKVPSPLLRNSLEPPYWVTSTSGNPSLLTSPMATPMLWPAMSSPEPGADIAERAVFFLVKEPIGGLGVRPGVIKEINVQKAVVVEIEQGGAGADDLRQQ